MKAKIISSSNVQSNSWLHISSVNQLNQKNGESNLVYADFVLGVGEEFSFHQHPNQTETLHLLSGKLEIWIGHTKKILNTGDSITIPAGKTHACFNISNTESHIFSILSSKKADLGFEVIDQSSDYPWCTLR